MSRQGGASSAASAGRGEAGWNPSHRISFWFLGALLGGLLFGASAPSPLYPIYQARWHFSSVTLTAIYAAYAFGALAALLIFGRLSDHVGRRRSTAIGLLVLVVAMLAFVEAQTVPGLFLARTLQGIGTGIAAGAINAWILDLQPPGDRRLGGLVSGVALVAGLALGAAGSGYLAQYAPDPLHLVFWLLTGVYLVALGTLAVVPDIVERRPGWFRSIRPEVGVPSDARPLFAATAPSLVATWAVAGFYLSLGPLLAGLLLHTTNHVAGGLVIAALLGVGAVGSFVVRRADPGDVVVRASLILIAGVAVSLFGVALGSAVGLYAGSTIAGLGFGPAFSGIFRSLAPLAPPDRRGALLAAIYCTVYLAFSVPSILAGLAVALYGLRATTYAFGLVVMALAATTTVALTRRTRVGHGERREASATE